MMQVPDPDWKRCPDIVADESAAVAYGDEDSFECARCGKSISEQQSAYGLCAHCEAAVLERFKWLLNNEFDLSERKYIDACCDGISLTDPQAIKPVLAWNGVSVIKSEEAEKC